jgi:hypothetical protein
MCKIYQQVQGLLRVVMRPLITKIPLIGGLQIFFLNNPDIDFNLVGVADVLDLPGLRWELLKDFFFVKFSYDTWLAYIKKSIVAAFFFFFF